MTVLLYRDLLIILAAGLVAGLACRRLGISLLIGYLVIGAVIGPGVLDLVSDATHDVKVLAEAGVLLLLFSIGLEFSLDELVKLGRRLLIAGSVQMVLVAAPVYAVLLALGTNNKSAVIIAVAVAFSSTVLVFKALSEWGQSSSPHGRRAIGILLFQDAALVPLLLLIPLWTGDESQAKGYGVAGLLLVSAILLAAVVGLQRLMARWGVPLFARSRSPELIVLFAIVVVGGVTLAAYQAGLPPAIGGFAAGLILGGNRLSRQIDALMLSFREAFAAVFFVSLGMLFKPALVFQNLTVFALGLIAILALKSVAATAALRLTGIAWRPALGTGIGMAHVGEFAFMLMAIALDANLLSNQAYQRVFAVSLATLFLTPYLLQVGLRWARWTPEDRDTVPSQTDASAHSLQNVLVVGAGPVGRRVAAHLESLGRDVCVIDQSPLNLQAFAQAGFRTVAGDGSRRDILAHAQAGEVQLAIVCVSADEAAVQVVRAVRGVNSACRIIVRCRYQGTVDTLYKHGATEVVSEERQAAEQIVRLLIR